MQRFSSIVLALALVLAPLCGCEPDAEAGDAHVHGQDDRGFVFLQPENEVHPSWVDLGEIELGDTRTASLKLLNAESHPIVVQSVLSGCSCTIPEVFYVDASGRKVAGDTRSTTKVLEVPAGATMEVHLRVDSRLSPVKNKDKLVIVRITTDDDTDPYVTLEARMKIVSSFQSLPPELDLRRVGVNAGASGTVEVAPIGDSGRALVGVAEAPPGVIAQVEPSTRIGTTTWLVTVKLEPPLAIGYQEHVLRLATTGDGGAGEGRPFELKLRWTGAPDVEMVPTRLLFLRDGATGREHAMTELFCHLQGQRVKIVRHELLGEHTDKLAVTIEPAAPDANGRSDRWRVTLDPKEALGALAVQGMLVIETDDAQFPKLEVPIVRRGS